MIQLTISEHVRADRLDRLTAIAMNVGIGERVVLEVPDYENDKRYCLTNTGVILIKAMREDFLITAFLGTMPKVMWLYKTVGYDSIPAFMYQTIRNNVKYLKMCKQGLTNNPTCAIIKPSKERK